ncbi:hypothetical protein CHUAL_004871 [Chamberlinius hualienensis]
METAEQTLKPFFIIFQVFGITSDKRYSCLMTIGHYAYMIIEFLLTILSLVELSICLLLKLCEVDSSNQKFWVYMTSFALHGGLFISMQLWKKYVGKRKYSNFASAIKRLKIQRTISFYVSNKIKIIFLGIFLLHTIVLALIWCQPFMNLYETQFTLIISPTSIAMPLLLINVFILTPLKTLMANICLCFTFVINGIVSSELDNIFQQIKATKSPFRSVKVIKKLKETYSNLENVCKATNEMFTFVLFVSCAAGILPTVNFICEAFFYKEVNIVMFSIFDLLISFVICLRTIITAAQINSKVSVDGIIPNF